MARIAAGELEPGMVLGSDLRDQNGRFILAKGVKLTLKHLKIINTWDIFEADIEGISKEDVDAKKMVHIDPAILELADKWTKQRFIWTDLEHEVTRQLFQICVLRKAEEITNGAHTAGEEEIQVQSQHLDQEHETENAETKIDPRELIKNKIKLPSLPIIFNQINEAINDPRSSATHVASIISKDSGLSARMLKIVNSAFYGFPSRIDTISRAVAIIGTKQLSTLALATCALNEFNDIPSDLINMRSFWKHNITCGIIARIIASYKKNVISERFFLAGLLHDIGRLIMLKSLPLQAKEALLRARQSNSLLYKTEEEVMGFNHTLIGGMLLKEWNLPVSLETSSRYHHEPTQCQASFEPAVVHLSDIITNALGMGTSGEQFVPPLDTKAWEEIGLSVGILNCTVQQADCQVAETLHILFPNE